MASRIWPCDRDLSTKDPKDGAGQGRGENPRAVIGLDNGNVYRYFARYNDTYDDDGPDAPPVGVITGAWAVFRVNKTGAVAGTGPGSYIVGDRLVEQFDTSSSESYNTGDFDNPKVVVGGGAVNQGLPTEEDSMFEVDVSAFVQKWAPASVSVYVNQAGAAKPGERSKNPNHGIRWRTKDESKSIQHLEIKGQSGEVPAPKRPHIRVEYEPANRPPTAQWDTPTTGASTGTHYTGSYSDPDAQSAEVVQLRVYKQGGTNQVWPEEGTSFPRDETWPDGRWDVEPPPPSTLKKRENNGDLITYEGQARVRDTGNLWSAWTPKADGTFTITSTAPTIVCVHVNSLPALKSLFFETVRPWVAPDSVPVSYVAQLTTRTTDDSAAWQTPIWDSGTVPVTRDEQDKQRLRFEYIGPDLPAGNYSWRVMVTDALNEHSTWAHDHSLVLTAPYASPDDTEETAGYARVKTKTRVVLRAVDRTTHAFRRPGVVVGIIEDPMNLGCSANATTPGQLYFTLPNRHPQISVVEPWATHYRLEQYRGSQWWCISEGLITDFDASDTDTIFYGLDYLGVLSMSIEAKAQPDDLQEAKWPKGAKYVKEKISYVIKNQLERAIGIGDPDDRDLSPLGFFTIPTTGVDEMDNDVTIHSAYVQRLDFIRGLIDSYKGGGLGRRPRITARSNIATGVYEFTVKANAGKDRKNLRLEYGSLVQGYRVMALGDFAVHVYGVGRKRNELKPMFRDIVAPQATGDPSPLKQWGNLAKASMWQDLSDEKDLVRRARQMVNEVSRVGKRVALGLRTDGLLPEDGWAICDNVPVDIVDGTVDTSRYGNSPPSGGPGLWTIWGWEYRLFPDGHDEMTLVLKPKETAGTASPDLIPSTPIHNQPEWRVGHGAPTPAPGA